MSKDQVLKELLAAVGSEVRVSDWLELTQERVNAFADATGDHQWIHCDPARAARESPAGGTIAHGYLTLSLYPWLAGLVDGRSRYPGVRSAINYGINRLRFPATLPVGARVRGRITLKAVEEAGEGLQITEQYTAEVEGGGKPACVAEIVIRLNF